jgi:NagD protein
MFHRARRKLSEIALNEPEQVVMIGDTMETDIRGAVEAGLCSFLVLTGSTQLESVREYVYQPTQILSSVADLVEEVRSGRPSNRLNSPAFHSPAENKKRTGKRHQTDALRSARKYRAMTAA